MAKNKGTVYLGYKDEEITMTHMSWLNSTVNKVGGIPDWPDSDLTVPACSQCSGTRPLIVQLYCTLENSPFHRSLYVFACLNPNCSNISKNWLCIRVQKLDTSSYYENQEVPIRSTRNTHMVKNIAWCSGSDDWGADNMSGDLEFEAHSIKTPSKQKNSEENGNVVDKIRINVSDDDDDSNSMENEICDFARMQIVSGSNPNFNSADEDNKNANAGIVVGGASGDSVCLLGEVKINTTKTCAEIEVGETDVVFVETPKAPEHDLIELLKHKPQAIGSFFNRIDLIFKPFFLSVDEERFLDHSAIDPVFDDHIRDLYQEYKLKEITCNTSSTNNGEKFDGGVAGEEHEMFEKSVPAHGDLMLFNYISTIQRNPGQILRYSRDTLPLLIAPINEPLPMCEYCNGETICEVQILPTIIPMLQIKQSNVTAPIEFGNVLIYTCLKSCWDTPDKMRYENVIVQQET